LIGILFSFRGRITRTELWIGIWAWLVVFAVGGVVGETAMALGYGAASWIAVGFFLAGMLSMQALGAKRAHDLGYSGWQYFLHGFSILFSRGIGESNMYGPAPEPARAWRFLGVVAILGIAGYAAAASGIEWFEASYCAPYVSASAGTREGAEQNWRQAVGYAHGEDYVTGIVVDYTRVCSSNEGIVNECTVAARACRRP
jgi:uncharacterized membrane protein YhaH (DUF805 family)